MTNLLLEIFNWLTREKKKPKPFIPDHNEGFGLWHGELMTKEKLERLRRWEQQQYDMQQPYYDLLCFGFKSDEQFQEWLQAQGYSPAMCQWQWDRRRRARGEWV